MSYRVGRRNPHTIYWVDDEPDYYDNQEENTFIGSCVNAGAAANLVARANNIKFVMSGEVMSDGDIIDRLRKENSNLKREREVLKRRIAHLEEFMDAAREFLILAGNYV